MTTWNLKTSEISLVGLLAFTFLSLSLFSANSYGYQVEGLFSAEVDVFDRSKEQRRSGIKQALEKVLIKVSGNRDVIFVPELIPSEKQIERFVEQFRYSEIEIIEPEEPVVVEEGVLIDGAISPELNVAEEEEASPELAEEPEPLPTWRLWVGFDSAAVLRLLQKANLPVWDKTRPLSLIWLAVEDETERYLLEPEIHGDTKQQIEQQAADRGLPLVLPLMDLEDRASLSLTDVWGDFSDMILPASRRYGVDTVLVGRVFREHETSWLARWTLYEGQDVSQWETQAETKDDVISEGVHAAADVLARRYAQVLLANLEPPLTMVLKDINSFEQYAQAVKYLESLTQIASLNVATVSQDKVKLSLSIRGSRQGLEKVIELGGVLVKDEEEQNSSILLGNGVLAPLDMNQQTEIVPFMSPNQDLVYRLKL